MIDKNPSLPSPLLLPDGCSLPDPFQVLHGDARTQGDSLTDNALADGVIGNGGESRFSALKPFQTFFTAGRAFALERASRFEVFVSYSVELFRAILSSIGKRGNVVHAEIHTDKLLHVLDGVLGDLHGLEQKLAFSIDQVGLSLDVGKVLPVMAEERHTQPSIDGPDRHGIHFVRKNTLIISNCSKRFKDTLRFLDISGMMNVLVNFPDVIPPDQLKVDMTERGIRTCLKFCVEIDKNVTIKVTNKYSIITIVNWDSYQQKEIESDHQNDEPVTSKRPQTRM